MPQHHPQRNVHPISAVMAFRGSAPNPDMVARLQSVISEEIKWQLQEKEFTIILPHIHDYSNEPPWDAATTDAQKEFDAAKQQYFSRINGMVLRHQRMIGFGISNRQTLDAAKAMDMLYEALGK